MKFTVANRAKYADNRTPKEILQSKMGMKFLLGTDYDFIDGRVIPISRAAGNRAKRLGYRVKWQ